jgi:hypothetical protein
VQGGSTGNFTLTHDTDTLATLPSVVVATGDVIVVHLNPATVNGDAPVSEMISKTEFPAFSYASNYDTAWDFHGGTLGMAYSHRVLRVKDLLGNIQDGVAFVNSSVATPPSGYPAELQSLQAQGHWQPTHCGGAPCTYTSSPTAVDVSANWLGVSSDRSITVRRLAGMDTDWAGDWSVGASSLGLPNP